MYPFTGTAERGFTLIELAIVLVIIGLIVGGVLVGQDLIRAAGERAQITQIEKFNQAANTFFEKYGYLPGDIPDPTASSFGFLARGLYAGQGDGNGLIQGTYSGPGNGVGIAEAAGETVLFWEDLSTAHLIEGTFTLGTPGSPPATITNPAGYFPSAKIGGGNYLYVWSGAGGSPMTNYLGLSVISGVVSNKIQSTPGLTVMAASHIDAKIDDGLPQTGRVIAFYLSTSVAWAGSSVNNGGYPFTLSSSITGSSSTCFDNAGGPGVEQYSVEISNGSNVNCALSFKMQAGD